ncbi:MAG: polysaccharide pyruvyl transferase family protein [Verrucomicrobia bacterium]|nr:polysaccharide pyruvyl transferase family protein [Verrucomicrobiota bacterium]
MQMTALFSWNQCKHFIFLLIAALPICLRSEEGLPLYYWQQQKFVNFGDYLSLKIVERIVGGPVKVFIRHPKNKDKKLLALGSLMSFAADGDVIWGTGVNGKLPKKESYAFTHLDIRAVRGPLTRQFLMETFQIEAPEIYGDPALLIPYLFPEFKRSENPSYDFIIIPHYSELHFFPKEIFPNAVYATDPWDEVIRKICDSRFVISSSLHGIVVAEAFGIPARMLRLTETEPLFKYFDYYAGTNRPDFQFAYSVEEALMMGGEKPCECDLMKLYNAFPFEFWPNARFENPPLEAVAKLPL